MIPCAQSLFGNRAKSSMGRQLNQKVEIIGPAQEQGRRAEIRAANCPLKVEPHSLPPPKLTVNVWENQNI